MEFSSATVTGYSGEPRSIFGNHESFNVGSQKIDVYLNPPHIVVTTIKTGGIEDLTPTEKQSSFVFGKDKMTNALVYFCLLPDHADRSIRIQFN